MEDCEHRLKVLLAGDSAVGKSCLLCRFSDKKFPEIITCSLAVDFRFHNLIHEGKKIKLAVWDTAGQERFRSATRSYYRGAHGAIVVYDVTDMSSFDSVKGWIAEIKRHSGNDNTCFMLVGNKCDVSRRRRVVSFADGQNLAASLGLLFQETSAMMGTNVDAAFAMITDSMMRAITQQPQPLPLQLSQQVNMEQPIRLETVQPKRGGGSSCCSGCTVTTATYRSKDDNLQSPPARWRDITDKTLLYNGQFSAVYSAAWKGQRVAVKAFRCDTRQGASHSMINAEITVLCSLQHPRLLNLLAVCNDLPQETGGLAILSEFMPRGSLYSLLHSRPDSPAVTQGWVPVHPHQRLRMALDIAEGMRFLHSSRIIHRDLKSLNVLVDEEGRGRICDFGLSSTRPQAASYVTGAMGTAAWTAPEVLKGEKEMRESADVFSYGVVLWELMTGLEPWEGLGPLQIIAAVLQNQHLPTPQPSPLIPPVLVGAMERCCKEDPQERSPFDQLFEDMTAALAARQRVAATCEDFVCPITLEVMVDPVVCADGHSYERVNIEAWLQQSDSSPKTNAVLPHKQLIPNHTLKAAIQARS